MTKMSLLTFNFPLYTQLLQQNHLRIIFNVHHIGYLILQHEKVPPIIADVILYKGKNWVIISERIRELILA